ncbi:MAG: RNA polymerase sigma-54 factor [Candidatus Scalindua sp. AMX11]|nr:MAG: RNA polymerase sigma-54 factor [Candidatus Scalindua sp.]NOG84876.1 RNA polymerase factor sigma-54 [Planctomycetota bacterium]RZV85011.1 MAG: RNA polymerase sigma-54 factor [Candidatus Scalindua sp. SCAELEC01]TDE65063.1 MAG: RNA polymerase sigma-54 factor [Candidatus Scalindua sp. AMX11]GJQ59454.1 MAG: RNA polymerase sigma-54 factor [Candidatus Scalindua sp.]
MRHSFGLEQRQVQKQIALPRMIQSMQVLQLPFQALEEHIEQQLAENPVLEKEEGEVNSAEPASEKESPDAPAESEKELVVDEKNNEEDFERLLELDRQIPDYFDDGPRVSSNQMQDLDDRQHDFIANIAEHGETLLHHLENQLSELDLDADVRSMADRIISSLDANGYLYAALSDLLPPTATSEELQLIEKALKVIQSLEPAGVGARNLRECLLLQLVDGMPYYEELKTLISEHLDNLKENRLPVIARKTGYSIELIQKTWRELRKLNPKPGSDFVDDHVRTAIPDVFVDQDVDGRYTVWLEEGRIPQLRISNYYRQRLMSGDATPGEKEYIKRKITAAQWLIESIEQRRSTLKRVAQAIVDHQTRCLDEGPEAIEPLKMQQIADKVGVHVTTVSRAVDDKWIQTPRGVLPLRGFFVGGTTSADGEEIAWDAIRVKLQEIVDSEDKQKPLSDDQLVESLIKNGFKVARRTVTKYRQKMGIPSSRQRRDWSKEGDGE